MSSSPLPSFEKLGPATFLYTPQGHDAVARPPLILFFSWMSAAAKHIAKYTATYQKLFPDSRIVLIRSTLPLMFASSADFEKAQLPAFEIVREHVRAGGEVLLHSFSNGGGMMSVEFMKMWKKIEDNVMPIRAEILDS